MQIQPHYITQHFTALIALHYPATATTTTLHYTTTTTTLLYTTIHQTALHYTRLQCTTLQHTTIHYTNYTTPQLQLQVQLYYTNYTTLQLQLATTTPLHYSYTYNYNYNCATPDYIQQLCWGDHCSHCNHSGKHNSNQLSVHQWIRSAICESQQPTLPIGFLFLKLPPPPCAALMVDAFQKFHKMCMPTYYIYTHNPPYNIPFKMAPPGGRDL